MDNHQAIELCRTINRKAAIQYLNRGVPKDSVAIAALYSAHETASELTGCPFEAIAWLQAGLRDMEQQLLREKREQEQ